MFPATTGVRSLSGVLSVEIIGRCSIVSASGDTVASVAIVAFTSCRILVDGFLRGRFKCYWCKVTALSQLNLVNS